MQQWKAQDKDINIILYDSPRFVCSFSDEMKWVIGLRVTDHCALTESDLQFTIWKMNKRCRTSRKTERKPQMEPAAPPWITAATQKLGQDSLLN